MDQSSIYFMKQTIDLLYVAKFLVFEVTTSLGGPGLKSVDIRHATLHGITSPWL